MSQVRVYVTQSCPYCRMALNLLDKKGVDVTTLRVDLEPSLQDEMIQSSGRNSVPQIFIGDFYVGGYEELAELDMDGKLEPLLNP